MFRLPTKEASLPPIDKVTLAFSVALVRRNAKGSNQGGFYVILSLCEAENEGVVVYHADLRAPAGPQVTTMAVRFEERPSAALLEQAVNALLKAAGLEEAPLVCLD